MIERDPYSNAEDEGIPDLQEGTPERFWMVDPQEEPLPGYEPMAVDDYGTTAEEQRNDEPLDSRLRRELPDVQPVFDDEDDEHHEHHEHDEGGEQDEDGEGDEEEDLNPDLLEEEPPLTGEFGLGVGADLDTRYERDDSGFDPWPDHRAGRLVEPDQGLSEDTEPAAVADDVGADFGGYSPEEAAVHVIEPEEDDTVHMEPE